MPVKNPFTNQRQSFLGQEAQAAADPGSTLFMSGGLNDLPSDQRRFQAVNAANSTIQVQGINNKILENRDRREVLSQGLNARAAGNRITAGLTQLNPAAPDYQSRRDALLSSDPDAVLDQRTAAMLAIYDKTYSETYADKRYTRGRGDQLDDRATAAKAAAATRAQTLQDAVVKRALDQQLKDRESQQSFFDTLTPAQYEAYLLSRGEDAPPINDRQDRLPRLIAGATKQESDLNMGLQSLGGTPEEIEGLRQANGGILSPNHLAVATARQAKVDKLEAAYIKKKDNLDDLMIKTQVSSAGEMTTEELNEQFKEGLSALRQERLALETEMGEVFAPFQDAAIEGEVAGSPYATTVTPGAGTPAAPAAPVSQAATTRRANDYIEKVSRAKNGFSRK